MELGGTFAKLTFVQNINDEAIDLADPSENGNLIEPEQFSANNPPWNGWVATGVWLLSVLLIIFVPLVFLAPYLASRGVSFSDNDELKTFVFTDPTAIVLQLAPVILAHLLTLLIAWLVITRNRTYSFREMLGWQWGGFKWWHAVLLLVVFFFFAAAMVNIFGDVENDFEKLIANSRIAVFLIAFFATFTAPLVEEVVYRGLLYSAFQRRFGMVLAVLFVTVLFTIIHVPQYSMDNVPDYATIAALLAISLGLTLVRAATGNLLPCFVLHTLINGIQAALLIAQPYLPHTSPNP